MSDLSKVLSAWDVPKDSISIGLAQAGQHRRGFVGKIGTTCRSCSAIGSGLRRQPTFSSCTNRSHRLTGCNRALTARGYTARSCALADPRRPGER